MGSNLHDEFLNATLPALDLVYNLARRMARDEQLVEDLVQETYVNAFEAWVEGRKPRKVEPWIATICLNLSRGFWRRASTRLETTTDESYEHTSDDDVEREALRNVQRDIIHQALWTLPEEQRVTITLMDVDGFTAAEVGKIMGTPRGTVLSRAHRGRKRLARSLQQRVVTYDS